MESPKLIICPCCGTQASVSLGVEPCADCGAFSVGPPLARPEFELPAYGLTAAVTFAGAILALVFAVATVFALFERKPFSLAFWNVAAAAETAAWQLKFILLPLAVAASVAGARSLRRVRREPSRYVGMRYALGGFATSAMVAATMLMLIGITVPERLRQHDAAVEAAEYADSYDPIRALLEYQQQFGTLPSSPKDLTKNLPDPDGSIARAAAMLSPAFAQYEPESTIASLPVSAKARGHRNASVSIRPIALRTGADEAQQQGESFTFTNYTLRLAGKDKKLCTPDDLFIRDGMIVTTPPAPLKPCVPAVKNVP